MANFSERRRTGDGAACTGERRRMTAKADEQRDAGLEDHLGASADVFR
jgi:hypothetical protein